MIKPIIFIIVSAVSVFYSWASLRNLRAHGFYRFFAWEFILILFLFNVEYWFRAPFSVVHIISWFLLLVSGYLVVHGLYLLKFIGRPKGEIENTTTLVTIGAYKYIRHPLYSSLLFLGWGIFFKNPSLLSAILVVATTASLVATAKVEEAEDLAKFSPNYAEYMKKTKMFIPFLF